MTIPKVEVLPIEEGATTDPLNVNKHTQRGGGLLENSLRKRGAFRSIASAGKGVKVPVVMAGNFTLEKAVSAGFTEVVNVHVTGNQIVNVVRDDIAPNSPEAIALGLEDNEIGKASYNPDLDILAAVMADPAMQALKAEDKILAGIVEGMGLKGKGKDAPPQIDRAGELQEKWQTASGQLWQLGNHRLLIGDCTVRENVERLMGGERADMVFTDPPYGMNLDTSNSNNVGNKDGWISKAKNYEPVIGDNADFSDELINTIFENFGYCKEIFIWGSDYFAELIPNRKQGSWVVWDKRASVENMKLTFSEFELCWSKEKHLREIARITWSGLLGTEQEFDHKRSHPTQKPTLLGEWFLSRYSKENNIIVDLYAGAGFSIIAAQNLSRRCYAMEISEKYGAVILERFASAFPAEEIKRLE